MTTRFSAEVAEKLLDKLATDDDFRALFEKDPRAAMRQLGHDTPSADRGVENRDPVLPLQHLKGGLASKEKIAAGRDRMLATYRAGAPADGSPTLLAFWKFDLCAE
jgi:putative modified peptide